MTDQTEQEKGYPRTERIECPECGKQQDGTVEFFIDWPFPGYQHNCEQCGFIIMESEWDTV